MHILHMVGVSGLAQQALQTPQTMLDEVMWCITEAPEQARLDALHLSTGHSSL